MFSPTTSADALDSLVVSISKLALDKILKKRFGDNTEAKIRALQAYLEKADKGLIIMPRHRRKAFSAVLSELKRQRWNP